MPRLASPKQEKFARTYAKFGNASRAYRAAYTVGEKTKPETVWSMASTLLADRKVSARVDELMALAAERATVSAASLVAELDQARTAALDLDMPSAAVSATMGKARVTGHLKAPAGNLIGKVNTGINIEVNIGGDDAGML